MDYFEKNKQSIRSYVMIFLAALKQTLTVCYDAYGTKYYCKNRGIWDVVKNVIYCRQATLRKLIV